MTREDFSELDHLLAGLPGSEPDALHTGRVRAQCHRMLARRQGAVPPPVEAVRGRLLPLVVAVFCLIYLSAVVLTSLRLGSLA